jgi:hypothetical protein
LKMASCTDSTKRPKENRSILSNDESMKAVTTDMMRAHQNVNRAISVPVRPVR